MQAAEFPRSRHPLIRRLLCALLLNCAASAWAGAPESCKCSASQTSAASHFAFRVAEYDLDHPMVRDERTGEAASLTMPPLGERATCEQGCCTGPGTCQRDGASDLIEYLVPQPVFDAGVAGRNKLASAYWGMKEPLQGTSWQNRPLHAGWFFGEMYGDELIADRVDQGKGPFGGYRLGWDHTPQWGYETRLGFAAVDLDYEQVPGSAPTGDILLWDASVVYYPWADAHWRPYWSMGLGVVNFYAQDDRLQIHDDTLIGMPIGGGMKYYHRNWLALRVELTDNIAFGSGDLESMHNWSLTAGVEVRFGGHRPSYWPWNPGPTAW